MENHEFLKCTLINFWGEEKEIFLICCPQSFILIDCIDTSKLIYFHPIDIQLDEVINIYVTIYFIRTIIQLIDNFRTIEIPELIDKNVLIEAGIKIRKIEKLDLDHEIIKRHLEICSKVSVKV